MTAPEGPGSGDRSAPLRPAKSPGVYKTGHLSVSSKGLGWKSWKRRWFLLTRISLIFFKQEPRGPIDGSLALGGIDLNSSGRVHVKSDRKQLILSFPDGRAFTLKTDSVEELEEWREALEAALACAPSASLLLGLPSDALFRPDAFEALATGADAGPMGAPEGLAPGSLPGLRDRLGIKSLVVGRPILLALEDIDGTPSFLERALAFIETHGVRVEGILRASGDVELVEKRLRDYEDGEQEFDEGENAHVIGDCIKHILRELPSSPVPPSCCTALLHALCIEEEQGQLEACRATVEDMFPDPNRRLVQRLLRMMRAVAEHESQNRMSVAAVAACMAPLLFRPLFNGECASLLAAPGGGGAAGAPGEAPGDDGGAAAAAQIMAATQAANQAQGLAIYLMENYSDVFESEDVAQGTRGGGSGLPGYGAWEGEDGEAAGWEGVTEAAGARRTGTQGRRLERRDSDSEEEEAGRVAALEAARQELRSSLAREVRANEMLRDSLGQRRRRLAEERSTLIVDLERMREALEAQREAHAKLQTGIKGAAPQIQLDPEIKREVQEIESMEQDVARLRSEMESLQRQLAHVQHKQQLLHSAAAPAPGAAVLGAPAGASSGAGAERKQRIEALLSLKSQLQAELESTMAMCLEEQQRSAQLEERRRQDSPASMEHAVAQQRSVLLQAQAALEAEVARGKELRRRMQLAQQKAQAAVAAPADAPSPSGPEGDPPAAAAGAGRAGGGEEEAAGAPLALQGSVPGQEGGRPLDLGSEPGRRPGGIRVPESAVDSPQLPPPQGDARQQQQQKEAAAELSARLEQYKQQRAALMQRALVLSSDAGAPPPRAQAGDAPPANGGAGSSVRAAARGSDDGSMPLRD